MVHSKCIVGHTVVCSACKFVQKITPSLLSLVKCHRKIEESGADYENEAAAIKETHETHMEIVAKWEEDFPGGEDGENLLRPVTVLLPPTFDTITDQSFWDISTIRLPWNTVDCEKAKTYTTEELEDFASRGLILEPNRGKQSVIFDPDELKEKLSNISKLLAGQYEEYQASTVDIEMITDLSDPTGDMVLGAPAGGNSSAAPEDDTAVYDWKDFDTKLGVSFPVLRNPRRSGSLSRMQDFTPPPAVIAPKAPKEETPPTSPASPCTPAVPNRLILGRILERTIGFCCRKLLS
jgi:hypothetical protein